MTEKKYTITWNGNFLCIAENGKPITGYFESYQKEDLIKIVDLLNTHSLCITQAYKDNQRLRRKNKRWRLDWDRMYQLCKDKGFTEVEIIKELERYGRI